MKITRRQLRRLIRETLGTAGLGLSVLSAMNQTQSLSDDHAPGARRAVARISPRPRGRFEATMTVNEEGRATVEVDDSTSIGDEASQIIVNALKLDGRLGKEAGFLKPGVVYKYVRVLG